MNLRVQSHQHLIPVQIAHVSLLVSKNSLRCLLPTILLSLSNTATSDPSAIRASALARNLAKSASRPIDVKIARDSSSVSLLYFISLPRTLLSNAATFVIELQFSCCLPSLRRVHTSSYENNSGPTMYRSEFQLFSSSKASDAACAMSSAATNASRPSFATEAIWLYARIGTTNAVAKFSIWTSH